MVSKIRDACPYGCGVETFKTLGKRFAPSVLKPLQTLANGFKRLNKPYLVMSYQERECPQCGEPVEGRANKIFCSAACRAQNFRDTQDETANGNQAMKPNEVAVLPSVQNWAPEQAAPAPDGNHAAVLNWLAENQRSETIRQENMKLQRIAAVCESLHSKYSSAITGCLKAEGSMLDKWALENRIGELEQLSTVYRTHPKLRQSGSRNSERLDDIYWLYDTLRALLDQLKNQPGPTYLAAKSILLVFTPKERARLRANLLPD